MNSLQKISKTNPGTFVANVPGSKSYTNRALVIAAHTMGKTVVNNALICDDTVYLSKALDSFDGISVTQQGNKYIVVREKQIIGAPDEPIFLGGAGTPVRLMLAFSASAEGSTLVTGNKRLSERPMKDILDAFDTAGIEYEYKGEHGCLPALVKGGAAKTNAWKVSGEISSQFLTSLLIHASQQFDKESVLVSVSGHLVSRPYVNMTLAMMKECGLDVEVVETNSFKVTPRRPVAEEINVEVDASGMSYLIAAAVLTHTTVKIPAISQQSAQGDVGLVAVMEEMGCKVVDEGSAITITGAPLKGLSVDMENMPDVVLTLAVVATQASSPVAITNIANLRVKECDRISACCTELSRLGVKVEEGDDWLRVHPCSTFKEAEIETYDDHRVAMAFSLLGLISDGINIKDPMCVTKSFPNFWKEMDRFIAFHHNSIEANKVA